MEIKRAIISLLAVGTLFSAGSAVAADMAVKARPAPIMAVPFSWTGFYVGINAGGGWGTKDWTDPNNCAFCTGIPRYLGRSDISGWLVGGQVGANYQMGSIVLGVELDGSWADINGSHLDITTPTNPLYTKVDGIASATGRLGFAFDRALIYAKGGAAWVNEKHWINNGAGVTFANANDVTRWGWTIGGGLEYAFDNNWSIKGEYQYMDFTNESGTTFNCTACIVTPFDFRIDQKLNIAKVGLNYRFGGGGPVVARY
jgi:outer membrane immunogenic protein